MLKYGKLTGDEIEDALNRIGGDEGIKALRAATEGLNVQRVLALQRATAAWSAADIARFSEGDMAKLVLPVVRGYGKVELMELFVDLAADAPLPKEWSASDGWKIEEHRKGNPQWRYEPSQLRLHLSPNQQGDKYIVGDKLRKELVSVPVMNANLLDWLLLHPELIPDSWKGKYVFFWGTIYRHRGGSLCVRYLYWDGSAWSWSSRWLDDYFDADGPAVVSAS